MSGKSERQVLLAIPQWPSTVTCTKVKDYAAQHIWGNQRVSTDDHASEMSRSEKETVHKGLKVG
jgi:hypothetical protein